MFWSPVPREGCQGVAFFFILVLNGRIVTPDELLQSNSNQTFYSPPNASNISYARNTDLLPVRRIFESSKIGNEIDNFRLTTRHIMVTKITEDVHMYLALTQFLVSIASGNHFYLIFDATFEGIIGLLSKTIQGQSQMNFQDQNKFQGQRDVTVFRYDGGLLTLEAAIKGYYHVNELRNILVFCSSRNTLDLFRKITEKKLHLRSVYWYAILEEDISTDIAGVIKEGTQMTLLIRANERCKLYTSYINGDKVDFTDSGSLLVRPLHGYPKRIIPFLKRPLYRPLKEVYKDFGGRLMRSAVVSNTLFFDVEVLRNGSVNPVAGIDYMVLDSIAKKLNFTYQMVITEDGEWGRLRPDGSVSGMIGEVAYNKVNFAINRITITGIREEFVDFTQPYFFDQSTVVSRAAGIKSQALAAFSPFTPLVWLLIVVSTIVMGAVIRFVMLFNLMRPGDGETYRTRTLFTCIFTTFRVLVLQGNRVEIHTWGHRLLFYSWYLFCFILYVMYGGFLTALLTVPSYEDNIDSLWDIPNAVEHNGYEVLLSKGSSTTRRFSEATGGIYAKVWEIFDPNTGYVPRSDVIDKLLTGKYMYMSSAQALRVEAKTRDIRKYHFSKDGFYSQGFGMACSIGAPYKANFDSIMFQLRAAGLITKWTTDEYSKIPDPIDSDSGNKVVITLVHLQGAFFIYVLGCMLAATASLVEYLIQEINVWQLDID